MSDKIPVITETGGGYLSRDEALKAFQEGTARAPNSPEEMAAIRGQEKAAIREEQFGGTKGALKAAAIKAVDVTGFAKPLAVAGTRMFEGDEAARNLAENLQAYEEVNPLASMVGTGASFLAPGVAAKGLGALAKGEGLLAKGAGLAAKGADAASLPMRGISALGRGVEQGAGRLLGTGTLGTIGGKALGMGAETALMGAQHELSNQLTEEALGNHALNGERIFAAGAHDFLYGAALGGALGVGSVLGKKAMGGVSGLLKGKNLAEAADDFAGKSIWQGAGPTKAMTEAAEQRIVGGAPAVGNHAYREAESLIGRKLRSFDDMVEVAEKGLARDGAKIGDTLTKGSEALEKSGQKLNAAEVFEAAEKQAMEKYAGIGGGPKRNAVKSFFDEARVKSGMFDEMMQPVAPELQPSMKLQDLWNLRKDADNLWTNFGNKSLPKDDVFYEIRKALENKVMEKMDLASEVSGGAFGAEYRAAKDSFAKFRTLEKALDNGEARALTNQPLSLTDKLMGAAGMQVGAALGGGLPGSMVGGAVAGWGSKFVRGKFPYLAAEAAQYLSRVAKVAEVSGASKRAMEGAIDGLTDSARLGAEKAIPAIHMFGKTPSERATKVEKTVTALNDVAAQSMRVGERLAPLSTEAPKTAAAIAAQTSNVTGYLLSKAPKPVLSSISLTPWNDKAKFREQDVAEFARAFKVAEDPLSVVHKAARGKVGRDEVEALRTMYPETYQEARTYFLSQLLGPQKKQNKLHKLPLDKRLAIITLFDIPTPLTEPGFVGAVQQGIAEQGTQQTPSGQATQTGRTAGDARAAQAASDAMRTDTERLDTYGSGPD